MNEGLDKRVSVVIPARNEGESLDSLLNTLSTLNLYEVIVVNDGSTDNTPEICRRWGVKEIAHPYPKGNGAAIKTGVRAARGNIIVFMDGDGQHDPLDIPRLVDRFLSGYDLVVGNRDSRSQAGFGRMAANRLYNKFASWMVGHRIRDLTSGFRVVDASKIREFLYLLPNGFSYPTTSTMAFFRAGYSVFYEPITAKARVGESHIRLYRDGIKFLLIIFKIGTLYSPLKVFVPISASFLWIGLGYYGYTYITDGRFTNMGALLLSVAVLTFLMGLISEQITSLLYSRR